MLTHSSPDDGKNLERENTMITLSRFMLQGGNPFATTATQGGDPTNTIPGIDNGPGGAAPVVDNTQNAYYDIEKAASNEALSDTFGDSVVQHETGHYKLRDFYKPSFSHPIIGADRMSESWSELGNFSHPIIGADPRPRHMNEYYHYLNGKVLCDVIFGSPNIGDDYFISKPAIEITFAASGLTATSLKFKDADDKNIVIEPGHGGLAVGRVQ
jgi:hypothetical protein